MVKTLYVTVDVDVVVIEPVIVAALVNGNDIVDLIDAVDADTCSSRSSTRATRLSPIVHGVGHAHGIVPVHERDHDHDQGNAHVAVADHDHVATVWF